MVEDPDLIYVRPFEVLDAAKRVNFASDDTPARGGLCRLLALLLAVQAIGVYLFVHGFFLNRYELSDVSPCAADSVSQQWQATAPLGGDLPSEEPVADTPLLDAIANSFSPVFTNASVSTDSCWGPRRFSEVIIVLVDALRFDFLAHNSSYDASPAAAAARPAWANRLPSVARALAAHPARGRLFKFVADAPTVTMQRLKGLTTGGLPTFLDIRKNFHSSAVEEDSWPGQLARAGRRSFLVGDDTWASLFPTQFSRVEPYPSFNVADLHTVDRGCRRGLKRALCGDHSAAAVPAPASASASATTLEAGTGAPQRRTRFRARPSSQSLPPLPPHHAHALRSAHMQSFVGDAASAGASELAADAAATRAFAPDIGGASDSWGTAHPLWSRGLASPAAAASAAAGAGAGGPGAARAGSAEWELTVAHMLGVDHVGHRYGPAHPLMASKLTEVDTDLSRLLAYVDARAGGDGAGVERWRRQHCPAPPQEQAANTTAAPTSAGAAADAAATAANAEARPDARLDADMSAAAGGVLLLVMGDHGMTGGGNHGGATADETDAGLLAYSSLPLRSLRTPHAHDHLYWRPHAGAHSSSSSSSSSSGAPHVESVSQIDLVPTLSLALGLPVPFGSLGKPIPDLLMPDHKLNQVAAPGGGGGEAALCEVVGLLLPSAAAPAAATATDTAVAAPAAPSAASAAVAARIRALVSLVSAHRATLLQVLKYVSRYTAAVRSFSPALLARARAQAAPLLARAATIVDGTLSAAAPLCHNVAPRVDAAAAAAATRSDTAFAARFEATERRVSERWAGELEALALEMAHWHDGVAAAFRAEWTQFDGAAMTAGLLLLLLSGGVVTAIATAACARTVRHRGPVNLRLYFQALRLPSASVHDAGTEALWAGVRQPGRLLRAAIAGVAVVAGLTAVAAAAAALPVSVSAAIPGLGWLLAGLESFTDSRAGAAAWTAALAAAAYLIAFARDHAGDWACALRGPPPTPALASVTAAAAEDEDEDEEQQEQTPLLPSGIDAAAALTSAGISAHADALTRHAGGLLDAAAGLKPRSRPLARSQATLRTLLRRRRAEASTAVAAAAAADDDGTDAEADAGPEPESAAEAAGVAFSVAAAPAPSPAAFEPVVSASAVSALAVCEPAAVAPAAPAAASREAGSGEARQRRAAWRQRGGPALLAGLGGLVRLTGLSGLVAKTVTVLGLQSRGPALARPLFVPAVSVSSAPGRLARAVQLNQIPRHQLVGTLEASGAAAAETAAAEAAAAAQTAAADSTAAVCDRGPAPRSSVAAFAALVAPVTLAAIALVHGLLSNSCIAHEDSQMRFLAVSLAVVLAALYWSDAAASPLAALRQRRVFFAPHERLYELTNKVLSHTTVPGYSEVVDQVKENANEVRLAIHNVRPELVPRALATDMVAAAAAATVAAAAGARAKPTVVLAVPKVQTELTAAETPAFAPSRRRLALLLALALPLLTAMLSVEPALARAPHLGDFVTRALWRAASMPVRAHSSVVTTAVSGYVPVGDDDAVAGANAGAEVAAGAIVEAEAQVDAAASSEKDATALHLSFGTGAVQGAGKSDGEAVDSAHGDSLAEVEAGALDAIARAGVRVPTAPAGDHHAHSHEESDASGYRHAHEHEHATSSQTESVAGDDAPDSGDATAASTAALDSSASGPGFVSAPAAPAPVELTVAFSPLRRLDGSHALQSGAVAADEQDSRFRDFDSLPHVLYMVAAFGAYFAARRRFHRLAGASAHTRTTLFSWDVSRGVWDFTALLMYDYGLVVGLDVACSGAVLAYWMPSLFAIVIAVCNLLSQQVNALLARQRLSFRVNMWELAAVRNEFTVGGALVVYAFAILVGFAWAVQTVASLNHWRCGQQSYATGQLAATPLVHLAVAVGVTAVVSGPQASVAIAIAGVIWVALAHIAPARSLLLSTEVAAPHRAYAYAATEAAFIWFLGHYLFFATGHSYNFADLHTTAAFVISQDFNPAFAFSAVTLNTFSGHIITALMLAALWAFRTRTLAYSPARVHVAAVPARALPPLPPSGALEPLYDWSPAYGMTTSMNVAREGKLRRAIRRVMGSVPVAPSPTVDWPFTDIAVEAELVHRDRLSFPARVDADTVVGRADVTLSMHVAVLTFLCLNALKLFVSACNVTIHSRHLMVWAIFAPKFIFDVFAVFLSSGVLILYSSYCGALQDSKEQLGFSFNYVEGRFEDHSDVVSPDTHAEAPQDSPEQH